MQFLNAMAEATDSAIGTGNSDLWLSGVRLFHVEQWTQPAMLDHSVRESGLAMTNSRTRTCSESETVNDVPRGTYPCATHRIGAIEFTGKSDAGPSIMTKL